MDEFTEIINTNYDSRELVIGSPENGLHMFQAFLQAMEMLGADEVVQRVQIEHPWFAEFWADMANGPGLSHDLEEAIDQMIEFDKTAWLELNAWLADKGLWDVQMWVYFSCHQSFGMVMFNPEKTPA